MDTKDNGGAAFPCEGGRKTVVGNELRKTLPSDGMTLRDYFAAKALAGFAAHTKGARIKVGETGAQANARLAYEYADAMLEARKQ